MEIVPAKCLILLCKGLDNPIVHVRNVLKPIYRPLISLNRKNKKIIKKKITLIEEEAAQGLLLINKLEELVGIL